MNCLQEYLSLGDSRPHPNKIFLQTEAKLKELEKELRDALALENKNYEFASGAEFIGPREMGMAYANGRRKLLKEILGEV